MVTGRASRTSQNHRTSRTSARFYGESLRISVRLLNHHQLEYLQQTERRSDPQFLADPFPPSCCQPHLEVRFSPSPWQH